MRALTVSVALAAVIAASAPVSASDYRYPSQAAAAPAAWDSTPAEALRKKSRVRVIVELVSPPVASIAAADSAVAMSAIASLQAAVLRSNFTEAAALRESGDSKYGLRRMTTVPAFAINVDAAELAKLEADSRVRSVSIDQQVYAVMDQSLPIIGMNKAAKAPYNASGKTHSVAIFDTGVDLNHKFLQNTRIIAQACFSGGGSAANSNCPNGNTSQIGGNSGGPCPQAGCDHGTHVAGTAAGFNTNRSAGEPKQGVAPQARIIAVQVFSTNGTSSFSDLILAMNHIFAQRNSFAKYPAAVNMSIGGGGPFAGNCDTLIPAFKTALDQLRNAKIAVVIASGNNGFQDGQAAPACFSTATSVGASTKRATGQPERIASYSNIGAGTDILAPGGDQSFNYPSGQPFDPGILSSIAAGSNQFAAFQGTSMAAPHIAGAFAAIRSVSGCAGKSVTDIEKAMQKKGLAIPDTNHTKRRVDVKKSLDQLGCP